MNSWLKSHLLPCPFKYLTGIDCPGCGFQRSVLALFDGDIHKSFALYPATIPLLITAIWWLADACFKLENTKRLIRKSLFICVTMLVVISYTLKLMNHYL